MAIRVAATNEGVEIPRAEKVTIKWSKNLFWLRAAVIPIKIPKKVAKVIAVKASQSVPVSPSAKISNTFLLDWIDRRK